MEDLRVRDDVRSSKIGCDKLEFSSSLDKSLSSKSLRTFFDLKILSKKFRIKNKYLLSLFR
jgi:hypothetical protein